MGERNRDTLNRRRWTSTPASVGTLTGSGAANRIAYWTGATTLTSNSGFTYDGTNMVLSTGTISVPGAGTTSEKFGATATAAGVDGVAAGYAATASGFSSTALGRSAVASGSASTAVGRGSTASGTNSIAIGESSVASGSTAVALGNSATALSSGTALGQGAQTTGIEAIAIGRAASAPVNTCVFGSEAGCRLTAMYMGEGRLSAGLTGPTFTLSTTGGSGTDVAGMNLTIQTGISTGNATPATGKLCSTTAGASSTTPQTPVTRFEWNGTGIGFFGATPVARAAAYVQTAYSTATRTITAALTNSTGGAADGTLADVTGAHDQGILNDNFTELHTEILNLKQLLTSLIDDSQGYGLAQ